MAALVWLARMPLRLDSAWGSRRESAWNSMLAGGLVRLLHYYSSRVPEFFAEQVCETCDDENGERGASGSDL